TTPADIEEPLVYDDTGDRVRNIQVMLDGLGYDTERTDGYFNRATEEAVKAFQSEHDLEVTGEVDAKTAGLIESKVIEKVRNGDDDRQMEKALEALYHYSDKRSADKSAADRFI